MKQAPAWNKVVEDFAGNPDVAFGDVALSKNQVRTIHGTDMGAGAGGWPTVRIFNKATGYGGKAYEKKTSEAMCDELGPKNDYMLQLIEEYASLCDVKSTDKGCTDKQKALIEKWADKPAAELSKQLERLTGMVDKDGSSMKAEALKWSKQRLAIFKQLSAKTEL